MLDPILPSASEFLAQKPIPHFIDGRFQAADGDATHAVINPSDGPPLAEVSFGGASEVARAVDAAAAAFPKWAATPPNERASALHRLADLMQKETAVLAQIESLDVGKAITASESFDIPFGTEGLVAGNAWINSHNVFAYGLPYGGINRSGLGGGVNGPATFYDYLRDQTIARPL